MDGQWDSIWGNECAEGSLTYPESRSQMRKGSKQSSEDAIEVVRILKKKIPG